MPFRFFFVSLFVFSCAFGKYMSNHDCKECHPEIYDEYASSWHAKGWRNDALHRAASEYIGKYDCATCHTPAVQNQKALADDIGALPQDDERVKDGVSCFYCHQIAYVKQAHRANVIVPAKQAKGVKPQLFGSLENPDESDKHAMVHSPIFDRYACSGCHSHKRNRHDVLIFRAMKENESSEKCIRCHMPKVAGGAEKMNKRARTHHHAHDFPGIHDKAFAAKGVDINLSVTGTTVEVRLHNATGHPLIIQPARVKFLRLRILRDGKTVWQNYTDDPSEDTQGYFATEFVDAKGEVVAVPYDAVGYGYRHNLDANATALLRYTVAPLRSGDEIEATWYIKWANDRCAETLKLSNEWRMPRAVKTVRKRIP